MSNEGRLTVGLAVLLLLTTVGHGGSLPVPMAAWHGLLLALGVWVLLAPAGSLGSRRLAAGPLLAFAGFGALACVSAAMAPYAFAAWTRLLEIGAFVAVAYLASLTAGRSRLLIWPLRVAAAAHGLVASGQRILGDVPRPASSFWNPNHLSGWLVVVLLVSLAASRDESRAARWWSAALALPAAAALISSGSRAALLGGAVGGVWLVARSFRQLEPQARRTVVAMMIVGLGLLGWRLSQRLLEPDPFNFHRLRIWRASAGIVFDRPVLGVGPGQLPTIAPRFQFADGVGVLRYDRAYQSTHSDPLRVLVEYGVPAAALLALALTLAARRFPGQRAGPGQIPPEGPIAALLAVGTQALFDNPSGWPALYVLSAVWFGTLLSVPTQPARRLYFLARATSVAVLLAVWLVGEVGPTLAHRMVVELPRGRSSASAAQTLERAVQLNPLHPEYRLRRAEALVAEGLDLERYALAREQAERAVRLSPQDSQYRWGLARLERRACLQLFGDTVSRDRVYGHYSAARDQAPFDARIPIDQAGFALAVGDVQRARRLAEAALKIEPNAVPARLVLAEALLAETKPRAHRARQLVLQAGEIAASHRKEAAHSRYASELLNAPADQTAELVRRLRDSPGSG